MFEYERHPNRYSIDWFRNNKLHTTEETLLPPESSWIANENPANRVEKPQFQQTPNSKPP